MLVGSSFSQLSPQQQQLLKLETAMASAPIVVVEILMVLWFVYGVVVCLMVGNLRFLLAHLGEE